MGPAGLAISAVATGTPVARPLDAATYFLTSNYLCAVIAYVIARVLHRVNMQLKDAREIGSYALIERLGAGGMGEVWRAQHRLLTRPAAIKLIRSNMLGESQRAREVLASRFEREARETAALGSIHTVDVYDFGVTEEGDFYYAMELLEGLSLERLVQEFGAVDLARTVYLLRQVCHSLGEAHARGLVHRDVKPANIMVCRLGPDADFVKVLDFGLVKHTAAGHTVTMVSMEGTRWGHQATWRRNRARSCRRGRATGHLLAGLCRLLHADRATRVLCRHARRDRRGPCAECPRSAGAPFTIRDSSGARWAHHGVSGEESRCTACVGCGHERRLAATVPANAWTLGLPVHGGSATSRSLGSRRRPPGRLWRTARSPVSFTLAAGRGSRTAGSHR